MREQLPHLEYLRNNPCKHVFPSSKGQENQGGQMKFQSKRPVESTTYELTAVSFGTEHCVLQLIRAVGIEGTTIKATGTLAMSMGEIREVAEALMHYTETGELMEAEGEA